MKARSLASGAQMTSSAAFSVAAEAVDLFLEIIIFTARNYYKRAHESKQRQ